jgi:hypothetical protein
MTRLLAVGPRVRAGVGGDGGSLACPLCIVLRRCFVGAVPAGKDQGQPQVSSKSGLDACYAALYIAAAR